MITTNLLVFITFFASLVFSSQGLELAEQLQNLKKLGITAQAQKAQANQTSISKHCIASSFNIATSDDLALIMDCKTITGDIYVGNFSESLIVLNQLQQVHGSFIITNSPSLVRLEAQKLEKITEKYKLERLTSLALISMPALTSAREIQWSVLPLLSSINFGLLDDLQGITISDTSLTGFSGFSSKSLQRFDINSNRFMEVIQSDVQLVNNALHIAGNAETVRVELPYLKLARNVSIHNVQSLNMESLEEVKGSVSIIENCFLTLDLPKLKKVDGTLGIALNRNLEQALFQSLSEVGGGLLVANNSLLHSVDFFPNLTVVGGAVELMGNIYQTEWPNLRLVKGSIRLLTTDTKFDCSKWSKGEVGNALRGGKIECRTLNSPFESLASTGRSEFIRPASSAHKSASGYTLVVVSLLASLAF